MSSLLPLDHYSFVFLKETHLNWLVNRVNPSGEITTMGNCFAEVNMVIIRGECILLILFYTLWYIIRVFIKD